MDGRLEVTREWGVGKRGEVGKKKNKTQKR